jgi:excisionase family DNA binding protein
MPLLRSPQTTEGTESLLSVGELARELSLGRTTAYDLLWSGEIPSLKIRGRRLVRRADLTDFIERRLAESDE